MFAVFSLGVKSKVCGLPEFRSQLHCFLALGYCMECVASPYLGFFSCKMGLMIVLTETDSSQN